MRNFEVQEDDTIPCTGGGTVPPPKEPTK